MATKDIIKKWFLTGFVPTQPQFWALFDSYWHKDEKLPITVIEDIENILNAKADAEALANHDLDVSAHLPLFLNKEDKTNRGVAGGYVPLNEFRKILREYLEVADNLIDGGRDVALSAEQGVILASRISAIYTLLASDNVELDNVQELVDAIELLQVSLNDVLVNDLTTGGITKALTAEMGRVLQLAKEESGNKQNSLAEDGTGQFYPTVDAVNAGFKKVHGLRNTYRFSPTFLEYGNPGPYFFSFQEGSTFDDTYLVLNFESLENNDQSEYIRTLKNGTIITITNTANELIVKKGVLFGIKHNWVFGQLRMALFVDNGNFVDGEDFAISFEGTHHVEMPAVQEMSVAIFTPGPNGSVINGQEGSMNVRFDDVPFPDARVSEIAPSTKKTTIPRTNSGISDGTSFTINNTSPYSCLLLKHNSASTYFGMKFPDGEDFILKPGTTISFVFDSLTNLFCFVGNTGKKKVHEIPSLPYTLRLRDAEEMIFFSGSNPMAPLYIPADFSCEFPIGTSVKLYNMSRASALISREDPAVIIYNGFSSIGGGSLVVDMGKSCRLTKIRKNEWLAEIR